MAECDKCGCFDDNEAENLDYPEILGNDDEKQQQWLEEQENYEPNRYYYWHGDFQEDYQMPPGYWCLCEECFGTFLNTGEIIEKYLDHFIDGFTVFTEDPPKKLNPKWNDETMGWFMPLKETEASPGGS